MGVRHDKKAQEDLTLLAGRVHALADYRDRAGGPITVNSASHPAIKWRRVGSRRRLGLLWWGLQGHLSSDSSARSLAEYGVRRL